MTTFEQRLKELGLDNLEPAIDANFEIERFAEQVRAGHNRTTTAILTLCKVILDSALIIAWSNNSQ